MSDVQKETAQSGRGNCVKLSKQAGMAWRCRLRTQWRLSVTWGKGGGGWYCVVIFNQPSKERPGWRLQSEVCCYINCQITEIEDKKSLLLFHTFQQKQREDTQTFKDAQQTLEDKWTNRKRLDEVQRCCCDGPELCLVSISACRAQSHVMVRLTNTKLHILDLRFWIHLRKHNNFRKNSHL